MVHNERNNSVDFEIKQEKNIMLLIECAIIGVLIVVGLAHKWATILAIAYSVFLIFKNSATKSLFILFFLLPFANIFKFNPTQLSMFTVLTFSAIIQISFKSIKNVFNVKAIMMILLFAFYLLCFSGFKGMTNIYNLLSPAILMYLFFSLKNRPDLKNIIIFFSAGIILASLFGAVKDKIPQLAYYLKIASVRLGEFETVDRFSGLTPNSNYYTMDIIMALSGLVVLFINKQLKISFYILAVTLSVFGLMSLSKSFLVSLGVLVFIYLVASAKQNVGLLFKSLFFLVIITVSVYFFLDPTYINGYLFRLGNDFMGQVDVNALTTQRTNLWEMYLNEILGNFKILMLGSGIGSGLLNNAGAHNTYLDMWYYLGTIGTIIFLSTFVSIFRTMQDKVKRDFIHYIPLLLLLMRGTAISLLLNDNFYYYIIITFIVMNTPIDFKFMNKRKEYNIENQKINRIYPV